MCCLSWMPASVHVERDMPWRGEAVVWTTAILVTTYVTVHVGGYRTVPYCTVHSKGPKQFAKNADFQVLHHLPHPASSLVHAGPDMYVCACRALARQTFVRLPISSVRWQHRASQMIWCFVLFMSRNKHCRQTGKARQARETGVHRLRAVGGCGICMYVCTWIRGHAHDPKTSISSGSPVLA
jgi:hypothetical protein